MAAPASGKKKKQKGKTLNLNEFLADESGGAATTVMVKPVSWADEMENNEFEELDDLAYKVSLPTAPRAARGPDVDMSRVPTDPPFTAFMGNLPFDVEEIEIERFFHGLKIQNIRFPPGKSKGFGYCDFEDRQSLVEALNLNDEQIRNRKVRIDLADQHQNNERNERREGGFRDNRQRDDEEDRTLGDWRRRAPDDRGMDDRDSGRDRYNDRGGDRDRGYGNRDRYGDRDHGDRGGFGDRDRGYGDRDRGGFGDRDRGYGDRDRGHDRYGDRDRGYGDRDRGSFGDRDRYGDRDRGYGNRDRYGDRDRGYDRDRRGGGGFGDRDRDRDGGRRAFGSGFRNDRDDRDGYGPPRDRGYRDSSFEGNRDGPDRGEAPRERPRLNLKPRSKPVEEAAPAPAPESGRAASIFGSAKPVDTAAREREIEERLARQKEQEKERQDQEREKRLSDEHERWRDGYQDERSPQYEKLSSSTSDRGGRTRSDSGSDANGPTERQRERKSSSSSGKNIRTVAPPPSAGSARVQRDSTLSGDEDVFEDGKSSKPTTPKEKEAPAKLVPAPPPKENVWQKRKEVQQHNQPPQQTSPASKSVSSPESSSSHPQRQTTPQKPKEETQHSSPQPKLQDAPPPKQNPWNRGAKPVEKTPPKTSTVSINDPPKENINPAPAPKENAWNKKPDITPHKNSVVVSVADPPKSDNVWARRKAEQDQKEAERKGEDGGFSGSHWGKSRGGANAERGGRGDGTRPARGARTGPNERGFGRGRGVQSNKPADKRERHERPLPKSVDEMPKYQEHSDKDWSSKNVFSNLANDEDEVVSDHSD